LGEELLKTQNQGRDEASLITAPIRSKSIVDLRLQVMNQIVLRPVGIHVTTGHYVQKLTKKQHLLRWVVAIKKIRAPFDEDQPNGKNRLPIPQRNFDDPRVQKNPVAQRPWNGLQENENSRDSPLMMSKVSPNKGNFPIKKWSLQNVHEVAKCEGLTRTTNANSPGKAHGSAEHICDITEWILDHDAK